MSIEISRRGFLGGLALFAASRTVTSYAAARGAGEPNVAFGVLSDVHICCEPYMTRFIKEPAKYVRMRDASDLEKAFAYFRDQGADGVVIAGDIADWGLVGQLQLVADTWNKVFPKGKGKGGRSVERLFALGNHDMVGWKYEYAVDARGDLPPPPDEEILSKDLPGNWQRIFGEQYEPIWMKEVRGYKFVGAHYVAGKGIFAVGPYMAQHAEELAGTKPFFYIQHQQPQNTCLGDAIWGHDNGCSTKALSAFPNAVAFSGHSHKTLTTPLNVWRGAFTSIATATLFQLGHMSGRENGPTSDTNARNLLPIEKGRRGRQSLALHGQYVRVYDDFIEIERREFVSGQLLGPNLVIPLPTKKAKPFFFELQSAATAAPAPFPEGAAVEVTGGRRTRRDTKKAEPAVFLKFPQTRLVAGALRTLDYEIAAETSEADVRQVLFTRHITSPNDFHPEGFRKWQGVCPIAASLLPKGVDVRFIVRGRAGGDKFTAPIYSKTFRVDQLKFADSPSR